jgi:hypothetical protein
MNQPSETLNKLTKTFTADRGFFDALMFQPSGEKFVEMCIWHLWLHQYLHDIQRSLGERDTPHGPEYQVWVVSMISGAAQATGMLMYLLARGVVHEAAASGRRGLEYLGMVSHLVRDPAKAHALGDEESREFERTFVRGNGNRREEDRLKAAGIRYRFSGMSDWMAKASTDLYKIFSRFNVHGGTMSGLTGLALSPTDHSCFFHNRSIEEVARYLPLFSPILEIIAIELMNLVGTFGTRNDRVNEAGACVLVWLDKEDSRWLEQVQMMRRDFGLSDVKKVRPN